MYEIKEIYNFQLNLYQEGRARVNMRRKGVRILAIFILICINISIFSRVNADTVNVVLESEEYAISQKSLTISRIIPKTDIEEFKKQFNLEKEKIHVYAKNGTTEMKNGVIGTGMKIRFDNIENEYTACVIGDINGDGEISQYEISKAIKHVVGLEAHQLSGINATAIDVDGDGEITQKDVSILIKYVVYGKLDIDGKKTPTAPIISVLSGEQGKNNWYTSSVELQINKPEKKQLKGKLRTGTVALIIALIAVASATYAWYVYNTNRHTTKVRMAAGAGVNLQISNSYSGTYGSAAVLDSFSGQLNPVSTNRISGGFQKVLGFTNGTENQPNLVANLFGRGDYTDYYQTSLFLRSNGNPTDIYIADIGFEDSDETKPISSAIRAGFVVHKPGRNQATDGEYIFAISDKKNPEAEYNTATGQEGYVLDCTKTDGTTVPFTPYTSDAYCSYNKNTGSVSLKPGSLKLCTTSGQNGAAGESIQIDLYIWLEGCDEDCTRNLCSQTLKNLSVSFAGVIN